MSDSTPSSPIPSTNPPTDENTRLLSTVTTSYSASNGRENPTVITMSAEENGKGSKPNGINQAMTKQHFQKIILEGQPTVPASELTEKIQDILVFSEIKKKQERRVLKQKKQKEAAVPNDSSSSSSSSSDSDSDDDSPKHLLKKKLSEWSIMSSHENQNASKKHIRKRDLAVDALRLATDRWKEKHGWSTGNDTANVFNSEHTTTHVITNTNSGTTVVKKQENDSLGTKGTLSNAESIFKVAKNASVCAILALLYERKLSGSFTEADVSLQALALSTLSLGLKAQEKSASHVVLYEMLTTKWVNEKSALEWAVENDSQMILNDARVQLVVEDLWQSGPNWRHDPTHPSNIWTGKAENEQDQPKDFTWYVIWHTFTDFLARWCNARYQLLVGIFTALVYLGLHLATVNNQDYTSDTPFIFEYVYYFFLISDLFLEFYKLLVHPSVYLKKISSYISLVTVSLLVSSFIIRIFTLIAVDTLEDEVYFLSVSFNLLIFATPLMFFRIFNAVSDISWNMAKTSYIMHECLVNSIWVFGLGIFTILGFWTALAALQINDIRPFAMLRFLVLGALHAPEIADTLYYQPQTAGLLLAVYLFLTIIVLGSLLTASFLATIVDIYHRQTTVKNNWAIQRCLRSRPDLNTFIPGVFIDAIFGVLRWFVRVVCKHNRPVIWLEKAHQVLWYIIYSPIILLVGLYELVVILLFKYNLVKKAFQPDTIVM